MSVDSSAQQSNDLPQRSSIASTKASKPRDETSRRKSSSKSRNGCVTCKARRVKCDESKPSCVQCTRRHLTCGGYRKDIKFRPVERPLLARGQTSHEYLAAVPNSALSTEQALSRPELYKDGELRSNDETASFPPLPYLTGSALDFSFPDLDVDQTWNIFPQADATSLDADTLDLHRIDDERERNGLTAQDGATSTYGLDFDAISTSPFPSPSTDPPHLTFGDVPDAGFESFTGLALLFRDLSRQVLTLYDDPDENPWIKYVWPMAKDSKALYHAIVAMAYLQYSASDNTVLQKGLLHIRRCQRALEDELNSGNMEMETALAAIIILGFAEARNYGASIMGRAHFRDARGLLHQALLNHTVVYDPCSTSERLKFLVNTWIYMDVIARITSDYSTPLDLEISSLFGIHVPYQNGNDMDSLMGYACTLFPVLGRVGDLVREIRARNAKRNSPAIISRAIELRKTIEAWASDVDLEHIDDPTPNMSDAIQTAEAYRWSTLLFLQQAVPELPNLGSVGELGQRTLVYIATIPMTSQTTIAHSYPLMIAGTEALDEDRDFVRERWRGMSTRIIAGIVDRCLEITEEVWRRRDTYLLNLESQSPTDAARTRLSSPISRPGSTDQGNQPTTSEGTNHLGSTGPPAKRTSSMSTHFPISAAFKKGVDPLTRSGNVEYTVKGRLHWLGVMKDWGWEVMLG